VQFNALTPSSTCANMERSRPAQFRAFQKLFCRFCVDSVEVRVAVRLSEWLRTGPSDQRPLWSGPVRRSEALGYCSISFVHHTCDYVCTTYVVRTYVSICTYTCSVLYVVAVVRVYVLHITITTRNVERGTRNSNSQLTQFIIIYLF
jgi:hypothetical protein